MDDLAIARTRARAQRVWSSTFERPEDVVGWMTAMQAQEHQYARWSIAQRARRATAADVDRAFDEGRVLRTHVLRPTWHHVAATDLRWLMRLSGPYVHAGCRTRHQQLGLDARTLARATDVIAEAVSERPRTRRELVPILEGKRVESVGQRMPYLLMHAELHSAVCSGPMQGAQHTYARFDDRVRGGAGPSGEQALAELTRRFFTARGPATVRDFAWWSGLPMREARRGVASIERDVECFERDGRTYWFAEAMPRAARAPKVDLVQTYDELAISYSESRDILQSGAAQFAVPRAVDGFSHVVLEDGRLLGHWRLDRGRHEVRLDARLAAKVSSGVRHAVARATARAARFFGARATD